MIGIFFDDRANTPAIGKLDVFGAPGTTFQFVELHPAP